MRCLYCGIRLRIAGAAIPLRHCPECSIRIEGERAQAAASSTRTGKAVSLRTDKEVSLRRGAAAASQLSHH